MDIHNNNNISANTYHSLYNAENAQPKSPGNETNTPNTANTSSRSDPTPVDSTRVSFSVEKDVNIIVTKVVDEKTKQIIRQIPTEEAIKRLQLLKTHHSPKL